MQESLTFVKSNLKIKLVRDQCHYTEEYRGAAHGIYNLKYSVPKKIPVVFHNGRKYDYNFVIKELAEKFKKQFPCLGEKYINFKDDLIEYKNYQH